MVSLTKPAVEPMFSRIGRYVESGAAIVLVSHDLATIEAMCSRAIWLSHGQIVADGPSAEVVAHYRAANAG